MYTVQIGRQFLELYNRKTGENLSALEFFEQEFFPIMFDSEDYLHLMQVTNSSFFQQISKQDKQKNLKKSVIKKNRFLEQINEVRNGNRKISGAIAVGFMAGSVDNSTSGQISDIDLNLSQDNILYSWFGGALGVGFGGGYDFLFSCEELLWFLFRGWQYYREFLNQTPKAKGRQIETWNGLWITSGLRYKHEPEKAYSNTLGQLSNYSGTQSGYIKLKRPEWAEQVFSLARYLDSDSIRELVYAYNYGQMNRTLGFMYIELNRVRSMPEIFEQLIQGDERLSRAQTRKLEDAYRTEFTIDKAFTLGGIGVRALQPKELFKFTVGDIREKKKSLPKLDKEEKRITFLTYITWIIAMLNNEETLQLAEEVAQELIRYEAGEERLRTRIKKIEGLWDASNRQQLIDQLVAIIDDDKEVAETLNKTVDQVMTKIPQDMYKLFLTLVKFKYHYYQSN